MKKHCIDSQSRKQQVHDASTPQAHYIETPSQVNFLEGSPHLSLFSKELNGIEESLRTTWDSI